MSQDQGTLLAGHVLVTGVAGIAGLIHVQIGPANPYRAHAQQDLTRAGRSGKRHVFESNIARAIQTCS